MEIKLALVTGCAGFIGSKLSEKLLEKGVKVVGIDNMNDYYDVALKQQHLNSLTNQNFTYYQTDIQSKQELRSLFQKHSFDVVFNLAARAGVRYSMQNPDIYMSTNAQGTLNLLECMRQFKTPKIVLASTSSLYAGQQMPFKQTLPVNTPISPYAASKKAAEVMCYTYHHLYKIDVSVLRYFTVYGPAGRPDMSPFTFAECILNEKQVPIFGTGNQSRDFTYIDDIAQGTILAAKKLGYEIINIGGGNKPYSLFDMIAFMQKKANKKAVLKHSAAIGADMEVTWADISKAKQLLGWQPKIGFEQGMSKLMDWHMKRNGMKTEK